MKISALHDVSTRVATPPNDGAPNLKTAGVVDWATYTLGLTTGEDGDGDEKVDDRARPAAKVTGSQPSVPMLHLGPVSVNKPSVTKIESTPKNTTTAGVYLKSVTLNDDFDSIIGDLRFRNNVGVAAILWDQSGAEPKIVSLDGRLATGASLTYAMRTGETKRFGGDGLALWPKSEVVGDLTINIIVYESDQGSRDSGEMLRSVAKAIRETGLTSWSGALLVSPKGVIMIRAGAEALESAGEMMEQNGDDVVGVFAGSYGTKTLSKTVREVHNLGGATIDLGFDRDE